MFCIFRLCYCLVISISAIDCLGRLVSQMTYHMSRGMLNPKHYLALVVGRGLRCGNAFYSNRSVCIRQFIWSLLYFLVIYKMLVMELNHGYLSHQDVVHFYVFLKDDVFNSCELMSINFKFAAVYFILRILPRHSAVSTDRCRHCSAHS